MQDQNSKEETQKLLKNLTIFKDQCLKNQNILQYLLDKFQSWSNLLERNKNLPVELEYQRVVESTKKYVSDIKQNYNNSLNLVKRKETETLNETLKNQTQNQIIVEKNLQNYQETLQDTNQNKSERYKIQSKAIFRIKPKIEPQKKSAYEKTKVNLKKYVQNNYRITPWSCQRKPKRKPKEADKGDVQMEDTNSKSNSNEQSKQQNVQITIQTNNEIDNSTNNQSQKMIDESSKIYEIDNVLLTKMDMSVTKISNFYIEKKVSFEDYLKQLIDFENYFEVKVPDFFKDKEIHHYRMIMNNYQVGLLKVEDVLAVKRLVEVSQNQRLVSALLIISNSFLRELLRRAQRIEKNKEEELLIEQDIQNSKEKNFKPYLEQIQKYEQKLNVVFPNFFKSKEQFMKREYFEKRFSLALSDEDCTKIYKIYQLCNKVQGHVQRQFNEIIQITKSQLLCIIQRAKYLLNEDG